MPTDVIMPALGMAQETGKVVRWLKAEGETVAKGEPLIEVETDKVTVEIEAPADGMLSGIRRRRRRRGSGRNGDRVRARDRRVASRRAVCLAGPGRRFEPPAPCRARRARRSTAQSPGGRAARSCRRRRAGWRRRAGSTSKRSPAAARTAPSSQPTSRRARAPVRSRCPLRLADDGRAHAVLAGRAAVRPPARRRCERLSWRCCGRAGGEGVTHTDLLVKICAEALAGTRA